MTLWNYMANLFSNVGNAGTDQSSFDRRNLFRKTGTFIGLAALVESCKKDEPKPTYDQPQGTGTAQGVDAGTTESVTSNPRAKPKIKPGSENTETPPPNADPLSPAQHAEIPAGDRLLIEGYLIGGRDLGDKYVVTIQERNSLGRVVENALPALLILKDQNYTVGNRDVNPYRNTANGMGGFLSDHNEKGCVNYARRCDKYSLVAPTVVQVDEIELEKGQPKAKVYEVIDARVTMAEAKGDQGKAAGIAEKWYEKGKKFIDDPRVRKVYEGGKHLLEKGADKVWQGVERGLDKILK